MTQTILETIEQTGKRMRRAMSMLNPRRVARHFKSVSRRLDEIACLIKVESAVRAEAEMPTAQTWERRFSELQHQIHALASQIERIGGEQKLLVEGVHSDLKVGRSTFDSLGLDRWKVKEQEGLLRYVRRQDYLRDRGAAAARASARDRPSGRDLIE